MNILNKIIKWIYQIEIPIECHNSENKFIPSDRNYSSLTKYNPATGLPIIGGLDIMGNLIGTSSQSDYSYHRNSMDNYYRFYSN